MPAFPTTVDPAPEGSTLVQEIQLCDIEEMLREVNRGLMVAFINRELFERFNLDVDKSIVLYGEDKIFKFALSDELTEGQKARLFEDAGCHYWSRGV